MDTEVTIPQANGVECDDCPGFGNYHRVDGDDVAEWPECPEDPDHAVTAVYITTEPLGLPNDADFLVHGQGIYAYPAEQE